MHVLQHPLRQSGYLNTLVCWRPSGQGEAQVLWFTGSLRYVSGAPGRNSNSMEEFPSSQSYSARRAMQHFLLPCCAQHFFILAWSSMCFVTLNIHYQSPSYFTISFMKAFVLRVLMCRSYTNVQCEKKCLLIFFCTQNYNRVCVSLCFRLMVDSG